MNTAPASGDHPLLAAVRAMAGVLEETVHLDPLYLSPSEKRELLVEVSGGLARLEGLRARTLAVADDVAVETGSRSAAAWLAAETRTSYAAVLRVERLGTALSHQWHQTAEAFAAGRLAWEQVEIVVQALEALPGDLDPDLVLKAEAQLLVEAGQFGPRELRVLGRRVLEVVAPDLVEAEQELALADEERRARAETRLSFRPRGDGSTDLFARLPDHVASRLRAYLDAFTAPRRAHLGAALGDVDLLPLSRRRGEAFCSQVEQLPSDRLPTHGGTATAVMVMIDLGALRSGLGLGETSTGEVVTAAEARRLACTANLLPVVLGGAGEVLDLGRARRLFSPGQRKALAVRDRRCRAEGCDIPAAWCEAHHAASPWSRGGRTDLADGLLLCSFHHHRAHDARWSVERMPNGDVRYARRT